MDLDEVRAAHSARLRALDPLLPDAPPLPDGTLLSADLGATRAVGMATIDRLPADTPEAEAVLADQATRGDWEHSATVTVPSRDTLLVEPLVQHGFTPSVATAVRSGRCAPTRTTSSPRRPACTWSR
ncbi:hypothetical protein [Streptoalloteichus hindustanus]|uniref:Uncharacterized protein n=1 Tax=Streptoalloteichus hindustanus TaxID=2017 RepID=A0A1M4TLW3_STRHI|nr:hypothetical protein [Streptoalloteichus hindustanus]SHE45395.1 hypothetical protein SAMN05444320_101131 [Streptoalloteichus hindustanus]